MSLFCEYGDDQIVADVGLYWAILPKIGPGDPDIVVALSMGCRHRKI